MVIINIIIIKYLTVLNHMCEPATYLKVLYKFRIIYVKYILDYSKVYKESSYEILRLRLEY